MYFDWLIESPIDLDSSILCSPGHWNQLEGSIQSMQFHLYSFQFTLFQLCYLGTMPPRQRGVPRRGGVWGIRARPEAQAIEPLAIVEPLSSPSEDSDQLDSQVHTSRCTFRCRRNQTRLSLLITVIATEEEDDMSDTEELDQSIPVRAMQDNVDNTLEVDITVREPSPDLRRPQQPTLGLSRDLASPFQPPEYSDNQPITLKTDEEIHHPENVPGEPSKD